MQLKEFCKKDLVYILFGNKETSWEDNKNNLVNYVKGVLKHDFNQCVEKKLENFIGKFKGLKGKVKYNREGFIKKYSDWLSSPFVCPVSRSTGRPVRNICVNKPRTRAIRTKEIRDRYKINELAAALEIAYLKAGYRGAGKLVRKIQLDPRSAGKYKIPVKIRAKPLKRVDSKAALSIFVISNLTKSSYNNIKRVVGRVLVCERGCRDDKEGTGINAGPDRSTKPYSSWCWG